MAARIGDKLGPLERSGDWWLTRIVPAGSAQDRIGAVVKLPKPEEQIRNVRVFGGVRSGGEWLGRPLVLPRVAADACGLSIAPRGGSNDGTIACEEKSGGTYSIRSDKPLDGQYVVQPAAEEGRLSPSWSRSLSFVRDAHVHRSVGEPKGAPIQEWSEVADMHNKVAPPRAGWEDVHPALSDLIEAVYAGGGSSGWPEAELVPMLSDILASGASRWDVLRSLQEAAMIEPFLRFGWKGRTWMLVGPTIAPLGQAAGGLVVIDGCIGARQVNDFREAVAAMGGEAWCATSRPLLCFASMWTNWTSVRKVKEGETTNDLYAFLTTEPNADLGAIHPKAMPVILTTPDEVETWMTAPAEEALKLQRPLPLSRSADYRVLRRLLPRTPTPR